MSATNGPAPSHISDETAALQRLLAEMRGLITASQGWLDKKAAASYWACSTRKIESAVAEGMPHAIIFARVKVRPSEAEPWLIKHGYLELRGEQVYDGADKENAPAAPVSRTPRGRTSEVPDAS